MTQISGRQGLDYILTSAEIEQFHRDGYVTLRGVLSEDELLGIEPDFDSFIRGEVPGMGRDFCDMSGSYDRSFEDYNLVNAVLPRKYRPSLQGNIFEQRSASIARQLLGEDATLDYDQFLAKRPAKPDAVFTWHQDLGYWPTGAPEPLTATCSLALDDADSENGCLKVVPGSHKQGLRPHQPVAGTDRDTSHILSIALTEDDPVVELPLKRGDITVHDEMIVHGSGGNISPVRWRRTYIAAFRSKACVAYERSIGFTHSHNDRIQWETHLAALTK
ncbi:phytanoyl-CoA dioxygenase family protein [Sphingobium sp. HBC34]|uniref:Phytanoyl-CoA dioxygenase family protein n=1 Tax=Sphingobium cyanobacteriorum TaxID=3063954 RepID=A0ABT8ZRQ9_9SPHN|nr:phytanoyl-CoA dioxygenase family protein [Sphingobium sp. HBC34]MDO7836634.1 phytanoyl-CoA dioxygenase family protein [Sphingobium sp. HBC34]